MMKLRPYQEEAVSYAVNMLVERGNSLIVAGTGAGKTIMMAAAIGRFYKGFRASYARSPHILVLVHRTEIHNQNHKKFSLVNPDIATSQITSSIKSLHGNVHFGMVQTVANIMSELEKSKSFFDLIVIDEAHHCAASTYEEIIRRNRGGNPNAKLLGVTATPNRGDEMPLIHLFDNFYQITTKFLIDRHYLTRPTFDDLSPVFETGNKAEKGHLAKHVKNDHAGENVLRKLCQDYLAHKEPGKSIIFAPDHMFCEKIYKILRGMGRDPAYLASGIDDMTRQREIEKFESGSSQELINVDICTEGYDFPPLRNLVDFDTNGTHGQWVQKVGRVLRTAPDKTTCTVIDFGGNIEMYPDGIETTVNLDGSVKKERGQRLTCDDFFNSAAETEKETAAMLYQADEEYTPYHLPPCFETVDDKELGMAYVACGEKNDCIIIGCGEAHTLYSGNKTGLSKMKTGTLDECMRNAIALIGAVQRNHEPIGKMQIKLLAPEYPTTALDRYGANCCLCLKAWRDTIEKGG